MMHHLILEGFILQTKHPHVYQACSWVKSAGEGKWLADRLRQGLGSLFVGCDTRTRVKRQEHSQTKKF
jgi:hypothetical protein